MRLHINLEHDLVSQIDEIAGSRGRSRFIREAVEAKLEDEVRLAALRRAFGALPDFAPWMTPEWISRSRREEGERAGGELDRQAGGEDAA